MPCMEWVLDHALLSRHHADIIEPKPLFSEFMLLYSKFMYLRLIVHLWLVAAAPFLCSESLVPGWRDFPVGVIPGRVFSYVRFLYVLLQAAAMPAGMGAMLPFGGSTDEEEEEPGVQLEGRMGWAGSSLSMDDTDTSLDANEAASTLEAASQSGNGDGGSAENGSGDNSSRSSSSDGATQVDEGSKVAAGSDKDQDALTTLTASTVSAAAATPAVKDAQEAKSMPGKADAAAEVRRHCSML